MLLSCPLTQGNALYMTWQRKILLGHPEPGFANRSDRGERAHMSRARVHDVWEAGQWVTGLMLWNEDNVVEMTNNVLFPDRHDFDMMN
ncbi:uncharacterized protein J7T54_000576 [Emericellopsis cladophorae]|uniref:Uncharacterized protein n=1 Tax=Emericellopsis cladophorae TaxID=2686198 RepID=A0A9P9Y528_9HYPO|nr:uncharacterized protein J7T54_000576 [Emericellopsis cladophorae]KAI6783074.1 hypothetical protein J7T54_000576 [Emericellopsis cladophorae]